MRHRTPAPSEPVLLEIADLAHDGRGVARRDGKVVFVDDALPGERVLARVVRRRRDVDEAVALSIEQPAAARVAPACKHFGVCGGCVIQHLAPEQQIQFKQKQLLDALQRIGKVTPAEIAAPVTGPAWGYRRRARLAVKHVPKKGGVLVGFRERHAPLIAALDSCAVLDPRVGERLRELAALVNALSIRAHIPQIEVAAAAHVALVFRVLQPPTAEDRALLAAFAREHDLDIHLQSGGPDSVVPLGVPRTLAYSPDGGAATLEFQPTDFIQVNGVVSRAMVKQALAWLAPQAGDRVLELFSGLGNFSLPLAQAGARVTAVEGEAALVARARHNALRQGIDIEFLRADLFTPTGSEPWLAREYDVALLDPPRSGAAEVLPHVAARQPRRIVYVSCHPGTLARDSATLVHQHGYRLQRAGVLDMFPHTAHVESMALFDAA